MASRGKPYLLIDVDGVLAPFGPGVKPSGFSRYTVAGEGEHRVWLNRAHGAWLSALHQRYELVWATGWGRQAAQLIAPILELPPMAVIEFSRSPALGAAWKLPDVVAFVGDTPTAWIDDDLDALAGQWAAHRSSPTLLIKPDRAVGLTRHHIKQLIDFSHTLPKSHKH
ncbi:MAG: hypothetical protein ACE5MI_14175 [Acidimicrobiia bacterium]